MDGVSWSTTRPPESFSRSKTSADTLSRLASFIARADTKHHRNQRPQTSQLPVYVCQECDKNFSHAADLLHHQELKHTLPKPHRCPSCGQEFSLRSSLQLHKCEHDSSCERCRGESRLSSACSGCTTRALDPIRLQDKSTHLQPRLLDSSPYTCAPCGRGFSQKQALLHHQQAGCSEPVSSSGLMEAGRLPDDSPPVSEGDSTRSDSSDTPDSSSRALSECEICSRSFRSEAGLERHKRTSHSEESLTATQGTKEGGSVMGTIRVNGGLIKRSKSKSKLLTCRSCDLVFRSTSNLYLHRKEKHSREKIVQRETRPAVVRRRRTGAYPCQVCGKVFLHHLSLRAHYKQHAELTLTAASRHSTNAVKSSSAAHKTVRAGPGRPRKVPTGPRTVTDPGKPRDVPEERAPEEEEEEEEEGEEREVDEEDKEDGEDEEKEVEREDEDEEEEEEEEEEEFPCPSCAEVFSVQSQLREHVELHQSSVRRRQCCVCTHEMDTCKKPGSKRHRLYHCVPCQQGFSTLDSFLQHCQEHLRVRVEEDLHSLQANKS